MDPRAYVRPLWNHKWLILLIVVVATAATYVYFNKKPRVYTASASVFVQTSTVESVLQGNGFADTDTTRLTANQAQLVTSSAVVDQVAKRIHFKGDPRSLLSKVNVTPSKSTDFVTIDSTAGSSQAAADIANGFADAFLELRSQSNRKRLRKTLKQLRAQLVDLEGRGPDAKSARSALRDQIGQLESVTKLPTGGAQIADRAVPGSGPVSPKPKRSAVFAFGLSLLLGVGLAYLLELFDRRVKTVDDIDATYPYPILAVVPHDSDVAPVDHGVLTFPRGMREAFRSLRTSIGLTTLDREVRLIVVTSAIQGEGKSTTVRNLALAYAESGKRVVVVETDMRRPMLASMFAVERRPGITDVLGGEATLEDALQRTDFESVPRKRLEPARAASGAAVVVEDRPDAEHGGHEQSTNGAVSNGVAEGLGRGELRVMVSGPQPPNPPGLLASARMSQIIDELHERFDVVLVDSPPLLAVSDAVPLISRADAVIAVSRVEHTTRAAGQRLVELLGLVSEAHVAGLVVNDVESGRLQETGLEYYYYGPPAGE